MKIRPALLALYLAILTAIFGIISPANAQTWSRDSVKATYKKVLELSEINEIDKAEALARQALEQSLQLGDSILIARGYTELAELHFFKHNLLDAEKYALLGKEYCAGVKDTAVCIKSAGVLGGIRHKQGKYSQAVTDFTHALELCKESNRTEDYYQLLFNSTNPQIELGMFTEALENLVQCQKYYEQAGNTSRVATIHNNLGLLYFQKLQEAENAFAHFRKAISKNRKIGEERNLARNYNNIALVFIETGGYDSASFYLDKAISMRKEMGEVGSLAVMYNAKGDLNLRMGDFRTSAKYYQKAKDIVLQFGFLEGLYFTNLGLGKAHDSMGLNKKAEHFYAQAYDFAKKTESLDYLKTITHYQYQHFKKAGNYKRALSAFEESRGYIDSVNALKQKQAFMDLKTKYETQMTERENVLLRKQKQKQAAMMAQDASLRKILIILIGISIVILLSLIVAYRSRNKAYAVAKQQKLELEKMNEKLIAQSEALNNSNTAKDHLFSVISHDLRAPLASIDSCLSILQQEDLEQAEQNELIGDLQNETQNTLKTLDDLLAWSRLQQNGSILEKIEFHINSLVQEVVDLYQPVAKHKDIKINFEKDWHNPIVNADPNQIRTVLRNLISNAIKFSPEKSDVKVVTTIEEGKVNLSVTDSGKGISEAELQKIKDPHQVYSSRGTSGEMGTGVGLLLSFDFLKKHGSSLHLQHVQPRGTRASFFLQAVPESEVTAPS